MPGPAIATNTVIKTSEEIDIRPGLDGHGLSETIFIWKPTPGKAVKSVWYTPYKNIGDLAGFGTLTFRLGSELGHNADEIYVEYSTQAAKSLGIRIHAEVEV